MTRIVSGQRHHVRPPEVLPPLLIYPFQRVSVHISITVPGTAVGVIKLPSATLKESSVTCSFTCFGRMFQRLDALTPNDDRSLSFVVECGISILVPRRENILLHICHLELYHTAFSKHG